MNKSEYVCKTWLSYLAKYLIKQVIGQIFQFYLNNDLQKNLMEFVRGKSSNRPDTHSVCQQITITKVMHVMQVMLVRHAMKVMKVMHVMQVIKVIQVMLVM